MPEITILTEAELRQLVPLDADAIACVEEAFRALATRQVVMPPILRLEYEDGKLAQVFVNRVAGGLSFVTKRRAPDQDGNYWQVSEASVEP